MNDLRVMVAKKSITVECGSRSETIEFKTDKNTQYAAVHIRERAQRNAYLSGDMYRAIDEAAVCFKGQIK